MTLATFLVSIKPSEPDHLEKKTGVMSFQVYSILSSPSQIQSSLLPRCDP